MLRDQWQPRGGRVIPYGLLSRTLDDATPDLDIHSSGGFVLRFGEVVAAGDSDGDGKLDLVFGTVAADSNQGEVAVSSSMMLLWRRVCGPHGPSA